MLASTVASRSQLGHLARREESLFCTLWREWDGVCQANRVVFSSSWGRFRVVGDVFEWLHASTVASRARLGASGPEALGLAAKLTLVFFLL